MLFKLKLTLFLVYFFAVQDLISSHFVDILWTSDNVTQSNQDAGDEIIGEDNTLNLEYIVLSIGGPSEKGKNLVIRYCLEYFYENVSFRGKMQ